MKPSIQLDAIIAKHVMGCKLIKHPTELYRCNCNENIHAYEECGILEGIKNYSTDIKAAWEIVEKLNEFYFLCGNGSLCLYRINLA